MGILFNLGQLTVGFNPKVKQNNSNKVSFYGNNSNDSFQITTPERLFNESSIKFMVADNQDLKKILSDNKLPQRFNMQELQELKNGHCRKTQEICGQIIKHLMPALRSQVDIKALKEGALLHDFGKVLIPSEVLNKNGKLTDEERKIMNLHSELGYHLLKKCISDEKVLTLVRYHHDNKVNYKNFVPDINLQILNLADRYSALTEERVYKKALTPQQALFIIYGAVRNGEVHPFLYKALVESVSTVDKQNIVNIS